MTALLLLCAGHADAVPGPGVRAPAPFLYFADHKPDLAKLVQAGRAEFLTQFPSLADPQMKDRSSRRRTTPATFERCKLDFSRAQTTRRGLPAHQGPAPPSPRGPGVPGPEAAARWTGRSSASRRSCCASSRTTAMDRLLVVNLGRDLHLQVLARSRSWRRRKATRVATGPFDRGSRSTAAPAPGRSIPRTKAGESAARLLQCCCRKPSMSLSWIRICDSSEGKSDASSTDRRHAACNSLLIPHAREGPSHDGHRHSFKRKSRRKVPSPCQSNAMDGIPRPARRGNDVCPRQVCARRPRC